MHNQCTLTWGQRIDLAWERHVDALQEQRLPNKLDELVFLLVRLSVFLLRFVEPVIRFRVGPLELWEVTLAAPLGAICIWLYFCVTLLGA